MLTDSGRVETKDKAFAIDIANGRYVNHLFIRLVAKGRRFTKVDFRYAIFDGCYLRDCIFDSCDFTGTRFVATNLHGSRFGGCKFDYATFERTNIDSEVLESGCPGHENLKMRFARSLRMNYQQLGDGRSVNKAIGVELQANEAHLYKAWHSNESYYRSKYAGWRRFKAFSEWLRFKLLELIWGNGESVPKLLRSTAFVLIVMALVDVAAFRDPLEFNHYAQALCAAPQIFLGILQPPEYPGLYLTLVLLVRLVAFGFFMAIVVKRLSRR